MSDYADIPLRAIETIATLQQKLKEVERERDHYLSNWKESAAYQRIETTHAESAESRVAALKAENAALIHDNARYVDTAAVLATENERLRDELARIREAMTAEIHLIRHFADCIREGNYLDQRLYLLRHIDRLAALTADPAKPEGESQ